GSYDIIYYNYVFVRCHSMYFFFFFSSRRRHTRFKCDWSSDVCSSDLISQEAKRRKAAGEDVIDLGAGEPDFPTPPIAADAGVRAIRDGKTHYAANEGILELRAAAATQLSLLSGGRPVNADHIVISNGSKQSLFNVCFSVFGPG